MRPPKSEAARTANAKRVAKSRAKKDAALAAALAEIERLKIENTELKGALKIKRWLDEIRSELAEGKKGLLGKVLNRWHAPESPSADH